MIKCFNQRMFRSLRMNFIEKILEFLSTKNAVYIKVLVTDLIRELVLIKSDFRIKNLQQNYIENHSEIVSVLFYLQVFGLITVEYPKRKNKNFLH